MITHKCPLLTYTHTHTHYHNHASLKARPPHRGETYLPPHLLLCPDLLLLNAVPNYTPLNGITLLSSASRNDFSHPHTTPTPPPPPPPALKGLFDASRNILGCCIDRVKLRVPPIRAQRAHCFISVPTAPSEMDDFSRGLVGCFGSKHTRLKT